MADIAIRFWDLMALSRDQKKLFPHFGEAGTAVFAVEEVEYGGHDRTPSFDHRQAIISLGGQYVIQITARLNELGIPTARGLGKWSAVQVARVLDRVEQLAGQMANALAEWLRQAHPRAVAVMPNTIENQLSGQFRMRSPSPKKKVQGEYRAQPEHQHHYAAVLSRSGIQIVHS